MSGIVSLIMYIPDKCHIILGGRGGDPLAGGGVCAIVRSWPIVRIKKSPWGCARGINAIVAGVCVYGCDNIS